MMETYSTPITQESLASFVRNAVPFTLLAFKGVDLISKTIRAFEKFNMGDDTFSHVGMLITANCCPFIPGLLPGHAYVWESTFSVPFAGYGDGIPDVTTGKTRFGIQIRDLEDVVPAYCKVDGAEVAYCALLNNPWVAGPSEPTEQVAKRRKLCIQKMKRLHKKYGHTLYEANLLQFFSAVLPFLRPARNFVKSFVDGILTWTNMPLSKDDHYVFCSEFVTLVYQSLGLISPAFKPHEVLPTDYFGMDADGMPRICADPIYLTLTIVTQG